jgi:hypothetical protein
VHFGAGGISTPTIAVGMRVLGSSHIADNSTVASFTSTSVTLNLATTGGAISSGTVLTFFNALPFNRISRNVGMRYYGASPRCGQGTDYYQEPHTTASRDFSHILFASSWLQQCGVVGAFLANLPAAAVQPSSFVFMGGRAARGGKH